MTYSRILLFIVMGLFGLGVFATSGLSVQQHYFRKAWKLNSDTGDYEYQETKPYLVDLAHRLEYYEGRMRPNPKWAAYKEICYSSGVKFEKVMLGLLAASLILNSVGL